LHQGKAVLSSGQTFFHGMSSQLRNFSMIRVAKQTRLPAEEIIERAAKYFGKGGQELTETQRNLCCISFEGIGGYVAVSVTDEDKHRTVDVESREFEYQAREFLVKI
jgi:hypothetical protein